MKTKNKSNLIIAILIPLAVGFLSSLISGNTTEYATVYKPSFAPPAVLFPIVWTILYILMGISSYLIYEANSAKTPKALKIYGVQLAFNFFWSIIFFGFSQYFFAFLWLLALLVLIALMIKSFYEIKPVAAFLQIPYFLWCLFAAVLNYAIYILNR